MWTPEYFLRYVELPLKVDGVTIPNNDGTFDIYINALHTEPHQKESLEHELRHIRRDHFYDDCRSVASMEQEARGEKPPAAENVPAIKEEKRLPDVMMQCPPGMIPLFYSLDSFTHYLRAYCDQLRREGHLPQ